MVMLHVRASSYDPIFKAPVIFAEFDPPQQYVSVSSPWDTGRRLSINGPGILYPILRLGGVKTSREKAVSARIGYCGVYLQNMSGKDLGNCLSVIMGDATGHYLAGSFVFILGLWWSIRTILKYICKQQKRSSSLITPNFFSRAEIVEAITIIVMALAGIIALFSVQGKTKMLPHKEMQMAKNLHWQHFIMYVFFAMIGVTKISCFTISSLPVSLVKLMTSNAFFVEAFVFYNHSRGSILVDIFVHQLVNFSAFLTGLAAFVEFLLTKNNVVLELLKSSLTMLQGFCFFQIGFILYPKNTEHAWDLNDHNNISTLAVFFCAYYALTYVIIGVNYVLVSWFIKWKLSKPCPSEIQFLKNYEQQNDSEDDM
ncbi:transmembrane protein 45A-like [Grammomys surdaster]|uniref:transmembrane protein 45A-like n=1 Tax=Grammomys surdaster TaxID=491861 RepID=UPI00109EED5A|nr:transmembrane protein 45A-like [Grammomys surdaster]